MRDELAALAETEAKRDIPTEVSAARFLISLHLPDAFPDPITLGLGEGGGDRQEELVDQWIPLAVEVEAFAKLLRRQMVMNFT